MRETIAAAVSYIAFSFPIAIGFYSNECLADAEGERFAAATHGALVYHLDLNTFEGKLHLTNKRCNRYDLNGGSIEYTCTVFSQEVEPPLSLSITANPITYDESTRNSLEKLFPPLEQTSWGAMRRDPSAMDLSEFVTALHGIEPNPGYCTVTARFSDDLKTIRMDHLICDNRE